MEFLRANPDAALAALKVLASRLRKVTLRLEGVTLQDVGQRLAQLLLERAARAEPSNGKISFILKEPHQRIAATLGTVREVIARQLRRFANEGLIEVNGRNITILDADRLRARIG
jgi:CRP/FNR family transcriptional regulator